MNCRVCKSEMEEKFSFAEGRSTQLFKCPRCGRQTPERDIAYTEDGKMIFVKKRKRGAKKQ